MKASYKSFKGVRAQKNVTKRDLVSICAQLKREFEQRYQGRFEFEPEQVHEGGIEMTTWPEKRTSKDKTIRFLGNDDWPGVENLDSWKDSDEIVISQDTKVEILCKALYGAVAWKPVEIKILKKVLAESGLCKGLQ
ncbi:hypothetical protein BASA81_001915 [Batrachochytrium salamandrivorans]|nr:hypothetical protein BASA81_001915 [Batrachochytrium salamandrivorans]